MAVGAEAGAGPGGIGFNIAGAMYSQVQDNTSRTKGIPHNISATRERYVPLSFVKPVVSSYLRGRSISLLFLCSSYSRGRGWFPLLDYWSTYPLGMRPAPSAFAGISSVIGANPQHFPRFRIPLPLVVANQSNLLPSSSRGSKSEILVGPPIRSAIIGNYITPPNPTPYQLGTPQKHT